MDGVNRRAVDRLAPYRLPKENVVVAMQEHWAARAEPIATAVFGFFLVIIIGTIAPARMGVLANLAWWLWFVLLVRAAWVLLDWQFSWFVATDKRLLLLYGIITRKVAMMPMARVTDMSYTRSPMGRLLGYGTFVLESAGQDQALSRISWVRNPDHTYQLICSQIFGNFDPAEDGPEATGGTPDVLPDPDGDDPPDGRGGGGPGGPGRGGGGPGADGGGADLVPDRGADDPDRGYRQAGDPTDVPIHHLGQYLDPPDSEDKPRWRRRRSNQAQLAPRVIRSATRDADETSASGASESVVSGADDTDPGWSVSQEDASPHYSITTRRHRD